MRVTPGYDEESWQQDHPAYRVLFWTKPHQPAPPGVPLARMGWVCDEYTVTDADVEDVLAWARATATGNPFTLFVEVRNEREVGLLGLQGFEPTAVHPPGGE
jgi:hypothetical protein